jgi:hypothetical protein
MWNSFASCSICAQRKNCYIELKCCRKDFQLFENFKQKMWYHMFGYKVYSVGFEDIHAINHGYEHNQEPTL